MSLAFTLKCTPHRAPATAARAMWRTIMMLVACLVQVTCTSADTDAEERELRKQACLPAPDGHWCGRYECCGREPTNVKSMLTAPGIGRRVVNRKIWVVLAHCNEAISWLPHYLEGLPIANITIISKCGNPVIGAPASATVISLPNVGMCDHSYAYWLARMSFRVSSVDFILFLKDTTTKPDHINRAAWRYPYQSAAKSMMASALRDGFGCPVHFRPPRSDWFVGRRLRMYNQKRHVVHYNFDNNARQIPWLIREMSNFGKFVDALGFDLPEVLQVCFNGVFVTMGNKVQQQRLLWPKVEKALSRGANIIEAHFMERLWRATLSNTLPNRNVTEVVQKDTQSWPWFKNESYREPWFWGMVYAKCRGVNVWGNDFLAASLPKASTGDANFWHASPRE